MGTPKRKSLLFSAQSFTSVALASIHRVRLPAIEIKAQQVVKYCGSAAVFNLGFQRLVA